MDYKVGDILISKYTYGGEVLLYKFFVVDKMTEKTITISEIDSITTYDDGIDGPHYYDAPKHVTATFPITKVGESIKRKISKYIKTEEFWRIVGKWDGSPLEVYNLH